MEMSKKGHNAFLGFWRKGSSSTIVLSGPIVLFEVKLKSLYVALQQKVIYSVRICPPATIVV